MDPERREHAEALLLAASRTHGIRAGRDEVQQVLDDPVQGATLADWAVTHLGADNLVTADEMALYTTLDQSGQVDRLSALHDLAEVQYISEHDMKLAVEELARSTDAMTKQADTLRLQQDALSRLVTKRSQNDARRKNLEEVCERRSEVERKHTAAEVEGLSQGLEYRLADLEQQGKELGGNLHSSVDAVLAQDDKLLASLQKLGWELDQQDPEEADNTEKLREVCMRLIKTTVETVRTKLDRVYLESLTAARQSGQAQPATEDEVSALQEEVESLYAEILPVAQMSVDQQHLDPALKSLSSRSGQGLARSAVAVTYISKCLDYLLDRGDRMRDTVETLRSHQAASASVIETAKEALAASVELPRPPPRKQKAPASPTRRALPTRRTSPIRSRSNTVPAHASQRRVSGLQEEPPIETLLQSLAIPVPEGEDGDDTSGATMRAVVDALAERTLKNDDVRRSGQEGFEDAATSHLGDVRLAVQLLRDSVLAESSHQEVRLVDPEIEGMVTVLAGEVGQVKERLAGVESRRGAAGTKSGKKAEMIERWAR